MTVLLQPAPSSPPGMSLTYIPLPPNFSLTLQNLLEISRRESTLLPPPSQCSLFKNSVEDTSLVVQWLRLGIPNAGGPGLIPDWGIKCHVLQPRVCMPQLKDLPFTTKLQCSQINWKINKNKYWKKKKSSVEMHENYWVFNKHLCYKLQLIV